jgi:transglutaminase-like putative cysteine protease/tetratricopeptide (TPR) repeat protein
VRAALLCALAAPQFSIAAQADGSRPQTAIRAEEAFQRGAPLPVWVDRVNALPIAPKDAALSIPLADVQIRVDDNPSYYQHRALTAHEASALQTLGQISIEFQPDYQRVQLHTLQVHRGGKVLDKLASADIRFLQRERNLEHGIYDGSISAQIVTDDIRVGDTLEIEYTVTGQNPVFGRHVMQAAPWDYPYPVAQRRVMLDMPSERMADYRMVGVSGGKAPSQSARYKDGRRVIRLEAQDLPAVLTEQYVPSDLYQFRWIQFSDFANWTDVNDWALDLFSVPVEKGALDVPLRAARAAKTQEEAVAKVLEFVQNDIRYLSVSLGENSHRPFSPSIVLERRYGDCKDKSLLAVTMLRALGIEAYPVLVASYMRGGLNETLPSPSMFDHAIFRVTIQGKEYYLDPTRRGQYGRLEAMGQVHGGRQVLVVKPGTMALSTIPMPPQVSLHNKRLERIEMAAMDKPAEFVERSEYVGATAESARVALDRMNKQDLHQVYEGGLTKRYPEAQMVGEPQIEDDRQGNALAIEVRYRVPQLFTDMPGGVGWSMNYTPSNLMDMFPPAGIANRNQPLAMMYPASTEYDLRVTLPPVFAMRQVKADNAVDGPGFKLRRIADISERSMHVNLQLQTKSDRVQASNVPEHLKNLQQYNDMMGGSLRAFKSDLVGATQPPTEAPKPLDDTTRLQQLVARSSRAIANADAASRDPSASLCERALAQAWLGLRLEALKDIARITQLQAGSDTALRCRADTFYVLGRFKESEIDYSKLIARGSDQGDIYLARGMSSLYLNKQEQAQSDFRTAVSTFQENSDISRAVIWYQLAGGEALPFKAGPDDDFDWLREVSALLAGKTEPERMLSRASRNAPGNADHRLVEAYFYAGRYYQAHGEKLKARVYFQRAVDKHVLGNPYHVAAQHELSRM